MTPIAAMVLEMMARGVSADIIALAVEGAELSVRRHSADKVDEQAERRREKDRLRKETIRRQSAESADIPQNSEKALNLPSSLEIENRKEKKVRARKCPLSAEWSPSEVHFEAAAKLNVSREAVLGKAEDMRIWAGSTGALKVDWDLTFHGFIRRDAEKLTQKSPQGFHHAAKNAPNGFAKALGNLREHNRQLDGGEEGRGPTPRLLSHG